MSGLIDCFVSSAFAGPRSGDFVTRLFVFAYGIAFLLFAPLASAQGPAPGFAPMAWESSVGGAPRLSVPKDRPTAELPFWRSKPRWRQRLLEERAVLVSVQTDQVSPATPGRREQMRFSIKGAGAVSAPKAFAFRTAQDFPKLKTLSSHFKTVEYHAPSRKLHLVTEALGWQARLVLLVRPVSEEWRDELQWDVIWGDFRGMKGVIGFEPLEGNRSEVSIEALYQAESLPLPKVLMGFALEVIVQKVAERMRTLIETEYKKPTPGTAPAKSEKPELRSEKSSTAWLRTRPQRVPFVSALC